MRILAYKPGHDGAVVSIDDGIVNYVYEAEKDSKRRHVRMGLEAIVESLFATKGTPDVIAVSGWKNKGEYYGHGSDCVSVTKARLFGTGPEVSTFYSSHERSHIFCAYGLSPFPMGQPCYAIVWEGMIGSLYEVDERLSIRKLCTPLVMPGERYSLLYFLGDERQHTFTHSLSDAGKLMALCGFSDRSPVSEREQRAIDYLLSLQTTDEKYVEFFVNGHAGTLTKEDFSDFGYLNVGLESQEFKNLADKFSNALFERFYGSAKQCMTKGYPLLISGGCGLNCTWNVQWKECGLFSQVFVPPCPNDSGSALGTAIEAQHYFGGSAKVEWDVYAGTPFCIDEADLSAFIARELDYADVARFLGQDRVIAWVQGRYEMGPRALCNRSLIAAPFAAETHRRLNAIKQREGFRPIAPVCLEEDVQAHFDWVGASPYMLYFQTVRSEALRAVTHVDRTARVQTITKAQNPEMCSLLQEFKRQTGYGVLCNTSLNFAGKGFINRLSDLARYVLEREVDGFVVGGTFYKHRRFA